MQPLTMTPATIVLLIIIVICAFLAVRRLTQRGMCDCHGSKEKGSPAGCAGCSHCSMAMGDDSVKGEGQTDRRCARETMDGHQSPCCHAADSMVANLSRSLHES